MAKKQTKKQHYKSRTEAHQQEHSVRGTPDTVFGFAPSRRQNSIMQHRTESKTAKQQNSKYKTTLLLMRKEGHTHPPTPRVRSKYVSVRYVMMFGRFDKATVTAVSHLLGLLFRATPPRSVRRGPRSHVSLAGLVLELRLEGDEGVDVRLEGGLVCLGLLQLADLVALVERHKKTYAEKVDARDEIRLEKTRREKGGKGKEETGENMTRENSKRVRNKEKKTVEIVEVRSISTHAHTQKNSRQSTDTGTTVARNANDRLFER